jgi:hypothetical protein
MVKVQNSEDASNSNTFSKMEGMILEKLLTMANQQTPLISEDNLRQSIAAEETSNSPGFESTLDKLIRDGFISRIGIDEFQITSSGIEEHSRLNEGTLL